MEEYMEKTLEEMNEMEKINQMKDNEVIISDEGERCRFAIKGEDANNKFINKLLELYNKDKKMMDLMDFADIKIRVNGKIMSFKSIKDLNDWMKTQN